jgi:hypothetical protein
LPVLLFCTHLSVTEREQAGIEAASAPDVDVVADMAEGAAPSAAVGGALMPGSVAVGAEVVGAIGLAAGAVVSVGVFVVDGGVALSCGIVCAIAALLPNDSMAAKIIIGLVKGILLPDVDNMRFLGLLNADKGLGLRLAGRFRAMIGCPSPARSLPVHRWSPPHSPPNPLICAA